MARTSSFASFLLGLCLSLQPLPTNRPRFPVQQRSRSTRRSIAPSDICKPKAPPG